MRWWLGFAAIACASCTLLLDTSDLSGGGAAAETKTDGGDISEGGVVAEGGTSTGAFVITSGALTLPNIHTNATLAVTIERKGAFAGDVSVVLGDNPNGLSSTPLVIPAGATTGALTVTSALTGMVGTFDLELRATSGADSATARVATRVGGPSGRSSSVARASMSDTTSSALASSSTARSIPASARAGRSAGISISPTTTASPSPSCPMAAS